MSSFLPEQIQALKRIDFPTPIRRLSTGREPAKRLEYVTFASAVGDTKTIESG
jgi:hypothetical protein